VTTTPPEHDDTRPPVRVAGYLDDRGDYWRCVTSGVIVAPASKGGWAYPNLAEAETAGGTRLYPVVLLADVSTAIVDALAAARREGYLRAIADLRDDALAEWTTTHAAEWLEHKAGQTPGGSE
jgi:hypothetical protein